MNCFSSTTEMLQFADSFTWVWRMLIPVVLISLATQGVEGCSSSCDVACNENDPCYAPQRCDRDCKHFGDTSVSRGGDKTIPERLASVEYTVAELKVMIAVLLALMTVLIFALAALFLHRCSKIPAKIYSHFVFRNKKNKSVSAEKMPQKIGNGTAVNGRASRIANPQSNNSPQSKRASLNREISLSTEVETQPRTFRVRQPSESTCPEETDEITEPQGYENLALSTSTISTSTLHNTSDSSTDTLGPTLSTATLQTTLHSEQPFSSRAHNTTV
ncbi:hypothetical protein SK128_000952 [Halocaridina rubra]|uniref:Uncharacterized protein n=1 Tax=Halocaridina rubra TaxID=373956 RepID=A0AAN9ACJ3_HALRR